MKKAHHGVTAVAAAVAILSCAALTGYAGAASQTASRTVIDQAGRTVQAPAQIKKVYGTSPVATILLYTLCPDLLAGWNMELRPVEREFIPEPYRSLPVLGGWFGKTTGSMEELVKARPDIIISAGYHGDADKELADRIQAQVNIPVFMADGSLEGMEKAYLFLGELTGRQKQARILADYCRETLARVDTAMKAMPDSARIRMYYAEGAAGLETEPTGSPHTGLLTRVGGINVAQVPARGGIGMTPVSMEQVLAWNPDALLVWNPSQGGAYAKIMSEPLWAKLKAVQGRRVYEIPASPFNWFDRPPTVNRLIGLVWLSRLLHPEKFDCDIRSEARRFCSLFYHIELTDEQLKRLLERAGGA